METVTLQLRHAHARKLLRELEEMNIIKIIEQTEDKQTQRPSQLRGFLSKEQANALLSHIDKSRNEWEERFPTE
ncbi:MAG: hypothetical protein ICV66_13010 [Chitinophagaceae bacterium]|nr:hypothetical protein [Chitinophagaceae bacterium]